MYVIVTLPTTVSLVHDSCTDSLALAECVSLRLYGGTDSERDGRACGRGAVAAAAAVFRGGSDGVWAATLRWVNVTEAQNVVEAQLGTDSTGKQWKG